MFCFDPFLNKPLFSGVCRIGWLVVLGFDATLTAKVISWRSVTHNVFLGFLTPVLTQLFFPKPPSTFLTCFCRGKRQKYTRKKSCLNRGSNSQPPGHELTRSPLSHPGGPRLQEKSFENTVGKGEIAHDEQFLLFPQCFLPFWWTYYHFYQI